MLARTVRAKIRELHFELQKTRAITARYEQLCNEQLSRDQTANAQRVRTTTRPIWTHCNAFFE